LQFKRRTLYGRIDRQFLPNTLRVFDFANPDLHIPLRSDTTVPQQALYFLNHPLVISYAKALAANATAADSDAQRVGQMYRSTFQRSATDREIRAALEFVQLASSENHGDDRSAGSLAWQYGYGAIDESSQRIVGFQRLPHFTGTAWQGGPAYPDGKLGWLQLSVAGGHPGNDRAHAVIRRWTAPRAMRVIVKSALVHEPKQGEGVRGFLVSSRSGVISQATVHHGQADLNANSIDVETGDTLDFVADIGSKLSYNQFLWKAVIQSADKPAIVFDSERDFAGPGVQQLGPWEQLAQVLLSSNEFLFID
jgi:hypothetical protein